MEAACLLPLVLVLLGAGPGTRTPQAEVCSTAEACVARLLEISSARMPNGGITSEDEAIGRALAKLGPEALPPLVALLEHHKASVRDSAAYAIGFFKEGAKPAVPALIKAMKNKPGWAVIRALGRTKDPAVLPVLEKELLRGDGGAARALADFGGAGVAILVGTLEARKGSVRAVEALEKTFESGGVPPVSASVVPRLVAVLADARRPRSARKVAIRWLTALGSGASVAIPELRKVHETTGDEELRDAASEALTAMGDGDVLPNALRELDSPDATLRRFAHLTLGLLGSAAAPAIPRLTEMLRTAKDGQEREWAAETLGWTRSPEVAPVLLEALEDSSWGVQYEAATALGRIGAREALPALSAVREAHWFGPVRRAAARAVEAIEKAGTAERLLYTAEGFLKARQAELVAREASREEQCWNGEADQWRVRKGEHWHTLRRVDRPRQSEPPPPDLQSDYTSFHRVQGGWLMGGDKGEFGGELWFVGEGGLKTPVVLPQEDSVLGFAELPGRLLLFTGMAHMGGNRGNVHTLTREADGTWTLHFLTQLAGFPQAWRIDGDLTVLVATARSGVVELSASGQQRMLPCP